jgi:SAM-dependent MidA family methyltransferase
MPLTYTDKKNGIEELSTETFSATWYRSFEQASAKQAFIKNPGVIIAHELFDALPVYQFVYRDEQWLERCVTVSDGRLRIEEVSSPNVERILRPG